MSSSISKIKDEINSQAEQELEKIKQETNEKLLSIEEATKKEIDKIKTSIEEAGKTNAENQAKRELGKTRLTAKMNYLKEKEVGIDNVFNEGKEKIKSLLQTSEYNTILNNLILSAGVALGGGAISVSVLKSDSSKVNTANLAQQITAKTKNQTTITILSTEPNTKIGGAVISKDDLWVDNTFESLISRKQESIRAEVSKLLFA